MNDPRHLHASFDACEEGSANQGCQDELVRADSNYCGLGREVNLLLIVPFWARLKSQTFPKCLKKMAGTTRLELATSAVTGQRSNQLNYVPAVMRRGMVGSAGLEPATSCL